MSRGHVHRLLDASEFVEILKTSPRGDVLPLMEAQVRPILQLPAEQREEAWFTVVGEAGGQQTTVPQIRKVVFEILNPDGPAEKPVSRAQQRIDLFDPLKAVIQKKKSWEQVERLLGELEVLL